MRNPNRIDSFLKELGELWHNYPDLRFIQMLNVIISELDKPQDPFYMEEEQWLELIKKAREQRG